MAFLTKQGQALNLMVLYLRGIYYSFLTEGVKTDQVLKPSNCLQVNNLKTVSPMNSFHFINTEEDPQKECKKIGEIISSLIIDVAFIGIGENAHVAFNDPPADFKISAPYIIVNLDDDCRNQQLGEGWFKTIEEVPKQAVSMSVTQIMKSQKIICSVPDVRKANAVKNSLTPPVTPNYPASILNEHKDCHLFLDKQSSSLLNN